MTTREQIIDNLTNALKTAPTTDRMLGILAALKGRPGLTMGVRSRPRTLRDMTEVVPIFFASDPARLARAQEFAAGHAHGLDLLAQCERLAA